MKEWSWDEFKSKADADFEKHKEYLIDKVGDYVCSTCKKVHYPTTEDINQKRPSTYYRGCRSCRLKSFTHAREYKKQKGNNYNKLYDTSLSSQIA